MENKIRGAKVSMNQEPFLKIKQKGLWLSEYLYLIMLSVLTAYYVLNFVCIDVVWSDLGTGIPVAEFLVKNILLEPYAVLFIIAVMRFICSEKYDWKQIVTAGIILYATQYAVGQNRYDEVLVMILLMLGAKGIPFRKIVKTYFTIALVIVAGVFLLSLSGVIENLIYTQSGRSFRMAFGFSYPTRFAAHIFFLLLWYWYLRDNKLTYKGAVLPVVAGIFVWIFCEARLSAMALAGMSLVMVYQIFQCHKERRQQTDYHMNSYLSGALSLSIPIATILITGLTMAYTSDSILFQKMNSILSGRLSLSKKAMDIYGFELWGQWIRLSGNGGYLVNNSKYFYIDSALLQFSIQYGIILLLILMVLFWYVGIRAEKGKKWVLLWIIAFVAFHGLFEPHTLRVGYCPLIFGVFAEFSDKKERTDNEKN